ncbi:hypothetical protein ACJ73_08423 [Blastomyces percursus]|uniref:Uncharacterized protein n=1 Tax=Blastomyces percursus TaxID=1658174 RepID=A0A1J9QWL1_9EURO|nr:hypothetical protein ACJ73_08423 [Blastomyces percursus]
MTFRAPRPDLNHFLSLVERWSTLPLDQSNDAANIVTLPEYTERTQEQHHGQRKQLSPDIKAKFPPISVPPGSIHHPPQRANVDLSKALHYAAKGADENAVLRLIDDEVFVDSTEEMALIHRRRMTGVKQPFTPGSEKWNGISGAAAPRPRSLVNAASHNGKTGLHKAVKGNRLATGELLFDHGADVNALDAFSMTPVDVAAAQRNSGPVVELLLKRGADVKNDYASKALHYAIRRAENSYCFSSA